MNHVPDTDQDLSVQQCEPVAKAKDGRVRCAVLRGDSVLGEFVLVRSDDGWLPIPEPGSLSLLVFGGLALARRRRPQTAAGR